MVHVALLEPEIPPNTGNIIRLCANCGAHLHLIKPLGFALEDKQLRRAGLDYHDLANVKIHETIDEFFLQTSSQRIFACSTKGKKMYTEVNYQDNDILLFGAETRGLPNNIIEQFNQQNTCIRIPMKPNNRSLNLSNACAIILFEAWRQLGFN
ncbi:MAG: tRNA (uridine(34)/cytosine(34)/5-carboxymethylaminomethyluridine(34)-2'-O)-methyltransferase TrmL [Legionellales bacterium]|nr:tRNA (uridine(34)/cytosine(34)/5-carboxymethylaminomethyluridine(34)-2'-O)-methyltransferase TrmL [Legionellales bacterium]